MESSIIWPALPVRQSSRSGRNRQESEVMDLNKNYCKYKGYGPGQK